MLLFSHKKSVDAWSHGTHQQDKNKKYKRRASRTGILIFLGQQCNSGSASLALTRHRSDCRAMDPPQCDDHKKKACGQKRRQEMMPYRKNV